MKDNTIKKFFLDTSFIMNFFFRGFVNVIIFIFLLLSHPTVEAMTYYISSTTGDDNRSMTEAQHQETPWKTLSKVTEISKNLLQGDSVLFKAGEVFPGRLQINASGAVGHPIVFSSYGSGSNPEITGFVVLDNWQSSGGGIWKTTIPTTLGYVNTVLINGITHPCGRYPNASAANGGYLNYDSFNDNTSISDSKLVMQPNWIGGQVVIRKARYVIDRNTITSESGNVLSYTSQSDYLSLPGYGYFIQNHASTLDINGEWYFQASNSTFGIYTGAINPSSNTIKVGVIETLIQVTNRSNISFDHLLLTGSTVSAFELSWSQNISINNCEIYHSGRNAITATGVNSLLLQNSVIAYTNNNACKIYNCTNTSILQNQIRCTGLYPGMGDGDSGSYEGILLSGTNSIIENNAIDSTGYIPITFSDSHILIKNNFISNYAMVKDDGGGIYTYDNEDTTSVANNRIISNNIIINGIGAGSGTNLPNTLYVNGIYMDDKTGHVDVISNTVANCGYAGIYLHNAHDITLKKNTLYNNNTQLLLEHDGSPSNGFVYNNTITENILFAKESTQQCASFYASDNSISNYGVFNNNIYSRPMDNDLTINVSQVINGINLNQNLSLNSWQAIYNKDLSSTKSVWKIPIDTVIKIIGTNKFINGTFDTNTWYMNFSSDSGNMSAIWNDGPLDAGCLKISFSSISGFNKNGGLLINIGAVTAGKTYRLKFSMLGKDNHQSINAFIRHHLEPYSKITQQVGCSILDGRQEKEFLFTVTTSESDASLGIVIPEQISPLYFDNIQIEEVNATMINPDQYLTFVYNPQLNIKTFDINPAIDLYANKYQNSITLQPFSSSILLKSSIDCLLPKPLVIINH